MVTESELDHHGAHLAASSAFSHSMGASRRASYTSGANFEEAAGRSGHHLHDSAGGIHTGGPGSMLDGSTGAGMGRVASLEMGMERHTSCDLGGWTDVEEEDMAATAAATPTAATEKEQDGIYSAEALELATNRFPRMYIVLISLHGLVRGQKMELGKDADTGGQVGSCVGWRASADMAVDAIMARWRIVASLPCDAAHRAPQSMFVSTGAQACRQ